MYADVLRVSVCSFFYNHRFDHCLSDAILVRLQPAFALVFSFLGPRRGLEEEVHFDRPARAVQLVVEY
jgi:hypothetical protein